MAQLKGNSQIYGPLKIGDVALTGQVTLTPPASGTPNFTLPSNVGTAGQFMSTNGAGVLSFQTVRTYPIQLVSAQYFGGL